MAPKKKTTKLKSAKDKVDGEEKEEKKKVKKEVKKAEETLQSGTSHRSSPMRRILPTEPMPTLLPGSVVETLRDTELYRSANCGSLIDTIPQETVLKILEQNKETKEICAAQFAGKQGFIRIINGMGKLSIGAAEKKTLSVNIKNTSQLNSDIGNVLTKYEITEGTVIQALYLLKMRLTENLDSEPLEDIEPKGKMIILKIGQGRRVRVRRVDGYQCGWVSAMDGRGGPLLGYIIEDTGQAEGDYEVGARLEIKVACKFTTDEASDAPTLGNVLRPGTIVIVQAIGGGDAENRKVQCCTEDRQNSGWVYALGHKGEAVLGALGQHKDAGTSKVRLFIEAAKSNNVGQLSEMLGSNSKSFLSSLKSATIKDPNVADVRGKSALTYAAGYGHYEATHFLSGLTGISVNMADDFDRTPLHYACKRMPGAPYRDDAVYARVVSTLLDHGGRTDDVDGHGATALMFAAFSGNLDAVKVLLNHQADVNRMTFNKRSASIMAAINGHRAVVMCLIHHGAPAEDAQLLDDSSDEDYDDVTTVEDVYGAPASTSTKKTAGKKKAKAKGKSKSKAKAKAGKKKTAKSKAKAQIMKEMGLGDDDKLEINDLAEQLADVADKPDEAQKLVKSHMKGASKMKYGDLNTLRTLVRHAVKLDMDGPDVTALHAHLAKFEAVDKMSEELTALVDSGASSKDVKNLMAEAKKAGLPDTEHSLTFAEEYLVKEKPKDDMKAKLRTLGEKGDIPGLEKMISQAEQGVLGEDDLEEFREIIRMAANFEEAKAALDEVVEAKDVEQMRIYIPMIEKMKGDVSKAKAVLAEEEPKYEARKRISAAIENKDVKEMKAVLTEAKKVKIPSDECVVLEDFIKAFEGLEKAVASTKDTPKDDEEALLKAKTSLAVAIKGAREVGVSEPDLYSAETMRKKYHNMLEDLKGAIRVFCRVRPISQKEIDQGDICITKPLDGMTLQLNGEESFMFDAVWTPGTQTAVFEDTKDLIQSAIDGYNVTIFAYGQTGAGKTFTMTGIPGTENAGVIPRACVELFDLLQQMENAFNFTVTVKMMELYNSDLKDLLAKDKSKAPPINIRVDKKGVVVFEGISDNQVTSAESLDKAIDSGFVGRTVKATAMNDASSRSHLIVVISIVSVNKETNKTTEGKLLLVDLAGSERLKKSEVAGAAQKEAIEINKSLTALGNVIEGLTTGSKNVPYRDHKLTMLMQDALGGTAKTLMFMNCSPAKSNLEETTMSLKYAQRAKKIVNKR